MAAASSFLRLLSRRCRSSLFGRLSPHQPWLSSPHPCFITPHCLLLPPPCSIPHHILPASLCTHSSPNPSPHVPPAGSAGPDSHENPEQSEGTQETSEDQRTERLDEKTQVLQAALSHVPKLGWSEAAMVAGARDVGLSPAIVGAFPRKEAALVEFFMDECLQKFLDTIKDQEEEIASMVLQDRIVKLVRIRLEMQAPYITRWAQALSIQANPANIPTSFKQRALLVDDIWHAAGDLSSDMDWYAKRGMLAAVYTATELYMLTDYSPDFRESWTFLERRVKDAFNCRKTAQEANQLAQAIGAGLGSTLQSLFKR